MSLSIARSSLFPALGLVSSVVEKRQTLPILSNLYFSHKSGKIRIIGTDLEVEMSVVTQGAVGEDMNFTVSARKIVDIVRMLGEKQDISFKRDGDSIVVSSARSRYKLKTLDAAEYPRIETSNWEERFNMDKKILKTLISKTAFSMAVQDVRYYLNGVLFELEKNILRAIATDGHRLAQSEVDVSLDTSDPRQIILPRKAVLEILRFIDGDDEESEVTFEMNKNHLKITNHEKTLITKLIDGKFPEFKSVLLTPLDTIISVDRCVFIEVLNRVSILTTDRFKGVKFSFSPGVMRITANNPEQEEAMEEIEIDYSGEGVKTGYNVSYLVQAAQAAKTDNIELHLQGNDGICILRQSGDEKSTWLVMPMRI